MNTPAKSHDIIVDGPPPGSEDILDPEALGLVDDLHRRFDARRRHLLAQRATRQAQYDAGHPPGFLRETRHFRNAIWETDPVPVSLRDRRCEIAVAPVTEVLTHALESPTRAVVADMSRASRLGLEGVVDGHRALRSLAEERSDCGGASIFVRPRPLSDDQLYMQIGGAPLSASLVDIGLHWFHCGQALCKRDVGVRYCIGGITHHLEVRLWQDIVAWLQHRAGVDGSDVRVSVVIDTMPAAFQMDEILFELRRNAAGLIYDRLGLIASYVACFGRRSDRILAPWTRIGMDRGFLDTVRLRMVETCHRRRTHAIAGHCASTLSSDDSGQQEAASARLRSLVARDIGCGYDGVAISSHAAIDVVTQVFDAAMPGPHQILAQRHYPRIPAGAMLQSCSGPVSREDIAWIVSFGIGQVSVWLGGGAVDVSGLEVCRAQVWQWLGTTCLADGSAFDRLLLDQISRAVALASGDSGEEAMRIFVDAATSAAIRPLRSSVHGPV